MFEQKSHSSIKQAENITVQPLAVNKFPPVRTSESGESHRALRIVDEHLPVGKKDCSCVGQNAVSHQIQFLQDGGNIRPCGLRKSAVLDTKATLTTCWTYILSSESNLIVIADCGMITLFSAKISK